MDVKGALLEQIDFWWGGMFRPRIEGLSDPEYLWEPVEGCWSVRKGPDGRFRREITEEDPDPPPVTTIAWRMAHMGGSVLGLRAHDHFGEERYGPLPIDAPATAEEGIAFVERGWTAWRGGLEDLAPEDLWRPLGDTEGPEYAEDPFMALVLHIHRELIHHGAEVALLRDLYRAKA